MEKKELAPGVFVLQHRFSDPTRIKYEILNETEYPLTMTIDLTGSVNLSFAEGKMTAHTPVQPGEKHYGGTVFVTDTKSGWKLSCKFSWTTTRVVPADEAELDLPDATVMPHSPSNPVEPHHEHDRTTIKYPEDQSQHDKEGGEAKRKELEKGITVVRTQNSDPLRFSFDLENDLAEAVEFTLNIGGGENTAFADGEQLHTLYVDAESSAHLGTVKIVDPSQGWSLSTKYSWKKVKPSDEYITKKISESNGKLEADVKAYLDTPLSDGDDALELDDLIKKCEDLHIRFVDTEFLPEKPQLFVPDSEFEDPEAPIVWRRARDFFGPNMDLFVKSIEPNDIKQGRLTDCWLLCSFAALAEFPNLVKALFENGHGKKQHVNGADVYQVRLCKNGEWQSIRLDDFFPCLPNKGPVYSRSEEDELWVLLLEKAFAKMCGCYDMLRGGLGFEALIDLTGCPTETITINNSGDEELWGILSREDQLESIMTASVPGEDKWSAIEGRELGGPGLVSGHAYSVIAAKKLSNGECLMNLRNPWGEFEWNGDWSDSSPLWTDALRKEVGAVDNPDDGMFWMSYADFRKHFQRINICHLKSEAGRAWSDHRAKGRFSYSSTCPTTASVTHPYFSFTLTKRSDVWVSIHQDDERVLNAQPYLDLGFCVTRKGNQGAEDEFVCGCGGGWDRQSQELIKDLSEGTYYVFPFTSGRRRNSAPARGVEKVFDAPKQFSSAFKQIIWEIFRRYDDNMDGYLNQEELSQVMSKGLDKELTEDDFIGYVTKFDSKDKGLTRDGFVAAMAQLTDEEVRAFVMGVGYDENFTLISERRFVVTVHSEESCIMSTKPFDQVMQDAAIQQWVKQKGTPSEFDEGRLIIYQLDRGTAGTTLAVESKYEKPILVTMDCSKSQNVQTTAGDLALEKEVLGNSVSIFHHLFPIDTTRSWQWAYRLNVKFP